MNSAVARLSFFQSIRTMKPYKKLWTRGILGELRLFLNRWLSSGSKRLILCVNPLHQKKPASVYYHTLQQLQKLKHQSQQFKWQLKMHFYTRYAWRIILLLASTILDSRFLRTRLRHVTTSCLNGSSTMDLAYLATDKKRDCLLASFLKNHFQLFI